MPGTLVLLPNSLGGPVADVLSPMVLPWLQKIDGLIAESERGGRRYLEQFQGLKRAPRDLPIAVLGEHQAKEDPNWFLEPCLKGETWGYVSDAGMPCIADPGARLVQCARYNGVEVVALPGPSAPMLALMLSGLPAQQFQFHGYPPKGPEDRMSWAQHCAEQFITQLCIEAPYRNRALLETLLKALPKGSRLCVAVDLMQPTQQVEVHLVERWSVTIDGLEDRPAVFAFCPARPESRQPRRR